MKFIIVFLGFVAFAFAAPLVEQRVETDPELTAGYFQGDIVLDVGQERNGVINTSYRWPNKTVIYKFADGFFDEEHSNHIKRGMQIIEDASCIYFKEATADSKYYINITGYPDGCYSSVGFLNRVQTYNLAIHPLDKSCFRLGSIVHELLHTLGFYHMQSDSRRDEYVRIAEENIQEGKLHNFDKYEDTVITDFNQEYDYGSLLHYPAYAFSKNWKRTIIPLYPTEAGDMGQRRGMSQKDINKLNIMYECIDESISFY